MKIEYLLIDLDNYVIVSSHIQTKQMKNIKQRYKLVESVQVNYDTFFFVINTFNTKHFIFKEYIIDNNKKHL